MTNIIKFQSKAERDAAKAPKDAVAKHNEHIMMLMHGVPAQRGSSESDADPRNPNNGALQ